MKSRTKLAWDTQHTKDRIDGKYIREHDCPYYNTARWHKLSASFRADPRNALCAECKRKGIIQPAEVVDHIVPWPICKEYFFDRSNLQPLCRKCNHEKGQRDKAIIQQWKSSRKESE